MTDSNFHFLYTNILVYYTLNNFDEEKHIISYNLLNKLFKEKKLVISTQILREFYAVVTNKRYLNDPLSIEQANNQIDYFKSVFTVLPININVINEPQKLLVNSKIIGQNIHDATIAATMSANRIETIWTFNKKDFNRFENLISIKPE